MNRSEKTKPNLLHVVSWTWAHLPEQGSAAPQQKLANKKQTAKILDPLAPLRNWLDRIEMKRPELARWICKLIPANCPFERNVVLFGRKLFHIPPLCKLNPLYEELVGLRFRALCYLADECDEDVTVYL